MTHTEYESRLKRGFRPVADTLQSFETEMASRFGDSVTLSLRFLPAGNESVHVIVSLTSRTRTREVAQLVWTGDSLFINFRSRIVRLTALNSRGTHATTFAHVLQDALLLGLDSLRERAA